MTCGAFRFGGGDEGVSLAVMSVEFLGDN
jgi:hypothetical protein